MFDVLPVFKATAPRCKVSHSAESGLGNSSLRFHSPELANGEKSETMNDFKLSDAVAEKSRQ